MSKKRNALIGLAATAAAAGAAGYFLTRRFASPRYRGPQTDHFDGRRFMNLDPRPHNFGDFLKWVRNRERGFWPDWMESEYGAPPPPRLEVDQFRVTFINHATTLLQIGGMNILTDPVWGDRVSPVSFAGPKRHRAPGIRFEDLPNIDFVLISHNHYDHVDEETLQRLAEEHDPIFFVPLGNSALLERLGIENSNDMDWWDAVQLTPELRLESVPAQHFSGRSFQDRDATLWSGYVLETSHHCVYFAGDTGYGRHFKQIAERHPKIDLALLPIGAFLPLWFMSPVHISPEEAVKAHRELGARRSMAIHFGTFALGDDGVHQPVMNLRSAKREAGLTEEDFWVLEEGEGREVPKSSS